MTSPSLTYSPRVDKPKQAEQGRPATETLFIADGKVLLVLL